MFSESAGRSSGRWRGIEAARRPKGGGERNVRRRVRLPRLRSRAYDLPLPRTTFNRGEIQAPSFLPKFFDPLTPPCLFNPPSLLRSLSWITVGGVTCFSTLRDLALSSSWGHILSSFRPSRFPHFRHLFRVTRKTRSCEQFFFFSPILQILYVCECACRLRSRGLLSEIRKRMGERKEHGNETEFRMTAFPMNERLKWFSN